MSSIRNKGSKNVVLINVPDELEGAFVFRNGLIKALEVNNIDTSQVKVVNYLTRTDYLKAEKNISVSRRDSTWQIYPDLRIVVLPGQVIQLTNSKNNSTFNVRKDRNLIYYWDREALIRLF
jgi:hypothetical protein